MSRAAKPHIQFRCGRWRIARIPGQSWRSDIEAALYWCEERNAKRRALFSLACPWRPLSRGLEDRP